MPSRKRNKGKERKSKKEEAKAETWWRSWVIGPPPRGELRLRSLLLPPNHPPSPRCTHGCIDVPPPDHAVCRFMNKFYEEWAGKCGADLFVVMKRTFDAHSDVWNNANYRQTTIRVMLRMGTNLILDDGSSDDDSNVRRTQSRIANSILILDCYDSDGDFTHAFNVATIKRYRSLPFGFGKRDILKFYSKRVACSCLKDKYKQARKTFGKMGQCMHCEGRKDRSSLVTCGRCKVPTYCSRECQVAHWLDHEENCDIWIDTRKRQAT